jgi:endo-beta-N-acetylglucosaminidase D
MGGLRKGVLMLAAFLAIAAAAAPAAAARGVFAGGIAGGPLTISCALNGAAPGQVRVGLQVGFADVRAGLESRLGGRRGRATIALSLLDAKGRRLARTRATIGIGVGVKGPRVYESRRFRFGRPASARILRYAQGRAGCLPRPRRARALRVAITVRQELSVPKGLGGPDGVASLRAKLRMRRQVLSLPRAQASFCAPYSCYKTAAEVLAWKPSDVNPIDVAMVPLAARAPIEEEPRMLIGLDNGPWAYWAGSDLRSQGSSATGNVYNFFNWQYVDSVYYYAHYLLSVPPTVWVNAAHRNGVPVFATVTGDCGGCGGQVNQLFEKHRTEAVDQLRALAEAYGFDGWMIDIENGARYSKELVRAMRELRGSPLPGDRKMRVLTYEAFQQSLGEELREPFEAAGEWQADYYHGVGTDAPRETYEFLGEHDLTARRFDTYWATDVYRPFDVSPDACNRQSSANFIWNGVHCLYAKQLFENLGNARMPSRTDYYQSLALYAPGWTAFGGRSGPSDRPPDRPVFQAADDQLWKGVGGYRLSGKGCELVTPVQYSVSSLLAPRPTLTAVPFLTNFDAGEGDRFWVGGKAVGGEWNLLSAQDPAPTESCNEGGDLTAAIDYGNAFDGGSSLQIGGTATPTARRVYFYEADATLPAQPAFVLRYFTGAGTQGSRPTVAVSIDGEAPIDLQPYSETQEGLWMRTVSRLPSPPPGAKLTRVGVGFAVPGAIRARLGELAVADLGKMPPPQLIAPVVSGNQLTWTDSEPESTQYYNVWAVASGATCSSFVGRAQLRRYDLGQPLFKPPPSVQRFVIQQVTTSGMAAELQQPACPAGRGTS